MQHDSVHSLLSAAGLLAAGLAVFCAPGLGQGIGLAASPAEVIKVPDASSAPVMRFQGSRAAPAASYPAQGGPYTVSVAELKVPDKARELFHKAQKALGDHELDAAREFARKALDIYPDYAEALRLCAVIDIVNGGDITGASQLLEQAVRIDPDDGMTYITLGSAYVLLHRFDDAQYVLNRGLSLEPNAWQGHFEAARVLLHKGRFQEALEQARQAIQLGPESSPMVLLVRAHAYVGLSKYPAAMADLEECLRQNPSGPESESASRSLEQVRGLVTAQAP